MSTDTDVMQRSTTGDYWHAGSTNMYDQVLRRGDSNWSHAKNLVEDRVRFRSRIGRDDESVLERFSLRGK